jgi:hypothetical protein
MKRSFNNLPLVLFASLASAPVARAEGDPMLQVRQMLARYDHEPSVLEVQRAAARYHEVNPEAYQSWLAEATAAAALPRRMQGIFRHRDFDERDLRTTTSTSSLTDTVSDIKRQEWWVNVEWDLSKLVFNYDRIRAAKHITKLVELREDILTTSNKLYFARREAQVRLLMDPPGDLDKALRAELRIEGLTADLDALTGGWFSRQLARAAQARP